MVIDTAHRSSIYQSLVPVMGEENATILMDQFPASEGDELVTKQFLRAELAEVRGELHTGLAGLRTEIADQGAAFHQALVTQTRWLIGIVLMALFGGLAASAAITAGFS